MNVSNEQVSKFLSGKNSPPFFRLYKFISSLDYINQTDIAFLFDLKIEKPIKKTKSELPSFFAFSDNPKLNRNINLMKQIYADGDETLIDGIELCLTGYINKFLKNSRSKKGMNILLKKLGWQVIINKDFKN